MKKIMVLTGKRGGYDAMLPLLRMIHQSDNYELQLIACDQHLMPQFGSTYEDIELPISGTVQGHSSSHLPYTRCRTLSKTLEGFAFHLSNKAPNLVLLYGDRGEVAAAALACVQMNVPVAHMQAGDVTGNLDDVFRSVIESCAEFYFTSNWDSTSRLMDRAIGKATIFQVGDQHIDPIFGGSEVEPSLPLWDSKLPLCLFIYHPNARRPDDTEEEIQEILQGLPMDMFYIMIYPCSDPGYGHIIKAIDDYELHHANVKVYKNLPGYKFRHCLRTAKLIVGNSSCGIIEAPYYKIPTVNIGDRQEGRLMGPSVINCYPSEGDVQIGIEEAQRYKDPYKELYGNGTANEQIFEILGDIT